MHNLKEGDIVYCNCNCDVPHLGSCISIIINHSDEELFDDELPTKVVKIIKYVKHFNKSLACTGAGAEKEYCYITLGEDNFIVLGNINSKKLGVE